MNVMLRTGGGVWLQMLVLVALAYGGSFVVRSITSALTGIEAVAHDLVHQKAVSVAVR